MKLYLHYVGKIYSVRKFIAEARRYGVSRCLPASIVKHLKWGQPILLAKYRRTEDGTGEAVVFGYFTISRLRHANMTAEAERELRSRLRVRGVIDSGPQLVCRGCGSYYVGGLVLVEDEVDEIVEKAEEVAENYGIRIKWFVEGEFRPLGPLILRPAKFSRGLVKVEIEDLNLEIGKVERAVVFSYDYRQQKYVRRGQEDTLPIDYYL